MTDLLLPDISEFQFPPRETPGANVAAIIKQTGGALIIRVSDGTTHPDAAFPSFRTQAHKAGVKWLGLYHYLESGTDAAVQAAAFTKLVGPLQPGEIPILDIEEGDGDQSARAAQWLTSVDDHYGLGKLALNKRSWAYSYVAFVEQHGLLPLFASERHTWIAAYSNTEPSIGHTLWQCTNGKTGAHITAWPGAGKCDTSVYHGTVDQLVSVTFPPAAKPAAVKHFAHPLSLDAIAAQRHTTTAHIVEVTRANLGGFPLIFFNRYVHRGTDKPMPDGQAYWTST